MRKELSILIPTYNQYCVPLVEALWQQAKGIQGLRHEILIADDGSDDKVKMEANTVINQYECCRYIIRNINTGRAAIRNFLAKEAQYKYLLYIDGDMDVISPDYITNYLHAEGKVVYGGYKVCGQQDVLRGNLRYLYETHSEQSHTVENRKKNPYKDFHTANFLISRNILLSIPFDERFLHYGYEDVLLGKRLKENGILIHHIDNPLGFSVFESNEHYINKTEEAMKTLALFQKELDGYSSLLSLSQRIKKYHLTLFIRIWHQVMGGMERRILTGNHPSMLLFRLYKLGYFTSIRIPHSVTGV